MKSIILTLSLALFLCLNAYADMKGGADLHSPLEYSKKEFTEEMHISRGGQLYDNWWRTTINTDKPKEDHPLWKEQSTNKRSGYSTYRCKECHGWDYLGKDGAYSKGSHYTGFTGVYGASQNMTVKELEAVLRGSTNSAHDFSKYLSKNDISDLALFLKKGIIDTGRYVNADDTAFKGNFNNGRALFLKGCMIMCHSGTGTAINFGDEKKPEFVGTIANKNPWEFIHKVRAGQPGTSMPSGIIYRWTEQDIRDLLAYSQTLPRDKPEEGWFDWILRNIGFSKHEHKSRFNVKHRGYGPKTDFHWTPD